MSGEVERRLAEKGVTLPDAAAPAGNYVPAVRSGNLLFVSGQLPLKDDKLEHSGTCGANVEVETAKAAARLCAINVLAQAKAALGGLDNVTRVVKVTGFVSSTADFKEQPQVINGASELFVEAFGDIGRHARAAVGMASLPLGAVVEVEAILEVA
jgi:enamine deaminase RidA (YjgF/YER057c/UK114 family)